jgi:Trk K+ transport system NAD-binding subunit
LYYKILCIIKFRNPKVESPLCSYGLKLIVISYHIKIKLIKREKRTINEQNCQIASEFNKESLIKIKYRTHKKFLGNNLRTRNSKGSQSVTCGTPRT